MKNRKQTPLCDEEGRRRPNLRWRPDSQGVAGSPVSMSSMPMALTPGPRVSAFPLRGIGEERSSHSFFVFSVWGNFALNSGDFCATSSQLKNRSGVSSQMREPVSNLLCFGAAVDGLLTIARDNLGNGVCRGVRPSSTRPAQPAPWTWKGGGGGGGPATISSAA